MQFMNLGLLGKNISYSLSPEIHSRIFNYTNVLGKYDLIDTDTIEIEKIIENYVGINITIPYKEQIMKFLKELDMSVKKSGAVNTVSINSIVKGYNTDFTAFLELLKLKNFYPDNALILGAGGASRAAISALLDFECNNITVVNRTEERIKNIKEKFPVNEELKEKYDIIVNTVPLKGNYFIESKIKNIDFSFYADFVYNGVTELTKVAKRKNIPGIDGIEILILQAVHSEEIWQGRKLNHLYKRLVIEFGRE